LGALIGKSLDMPHSAEIDIATAKAHWLQEGGVPLHTAHAFIDRIQSAATGRHTDLIPIGLPLRNDEVDRYAD
jgi:hypothetical protein